MKSYTKEGWDELTEKTRTLHGSIFAPRGIIKSRTIVHFSYIKRHESTIKDIVEEKTADTRELIRFLKTECMGGK